MTKDLAEIRHDFKRWRRAGVGIPTGMDNRIFDIETDTIEGHNVDGRANLRMLEARHGPLPDTLMAVSPTGSFHCLYNHPGPGFKIKSCTIVPGVDCKGDGGMFIAPPSVRGSAYRWLNARPIADAPDWLIEMVKEDAPRSSDYDRNDPFSYKFVSPCRLR